MTKNRTLVRCGAAVLALAAAGGLALGGANPTFEPTFRAEDFDEPGANLWFPLVPGTTYSYVGETPDGVESNDFTVTRRTITILGVRCVVVEDLAYLDGELVEATEDFLATDRHGNVWYFGEDTATYEDGVLVSTEGTWRAGRDGALPGILVPADPAPGMSYRQELAEGVAEDMARVLRLDGEASVAYGDFEDCLVTKEWSTLSPGAVEQKTYAPGVGLVLVTELSGGKTVRVELVSVTGP